MKESLRQEITRLVERIHKSDIALDYFTDGLSPRDLTRIVKLCLRKRIDQSIGPSYHMGVTEIKFDWKR